MFAADALFASQTTLVGEGEGELVRYRAAIVDSSGNELTSVTAGSTVTLQVYVQDLRTQDPDTNNSEDDRGVFSGYLDVDFTAALATFVGPITFSPQFQVLPDDGTVETGRLNEVGSTQSFGTSGLPSPLGPQEVLFFSAPFTVTSNSLTPQAVNDTLAVATGSSNNELNVLANDSLGGTLTFTPNAPEGIGHETLVLEEGAGAANPIPNSQILFQSDSVQVTSTSKPTITAVGQTSNGGTVTISQDGTRVIYTPAANFSGAETFTYTVTSGGSTATATATVNVAAVTSTDKVAFAQALTAAGVKFYGAAWCPFCTEQKQLFEDGEQFLPFIEVTNPDRSLNTIGQQNNITTFPTWEFPDGTRATGVLTLEELSTRSGVAIPTGDAPFLAPISNVTLLAGAPLHVALDGYDPNGQKITYTVQVTGASGVTANVLPQTRSMRVNMEGYEDMVFRLFDNEVPRVTNAIAELAQANIYDGVIFHRVIDNFVIQGGDPTGTGFGDPNLADFDDQFHFDLQHTQSGILSMAKAGDDTNSSQFFITEANPNNPRQLRALDFNHSVFGFIVEGDDVREAISETATGAQDRPTNTVRMTSVDVFTDEENGVLRLKAAPGTTGTATVTVTATDMQGKTTTRSFNVTVQADTFNGGPFLSDIPTVATAMNTPVSFQLQGNDVEGDAITYGGSIPQGATPTFDFTVNPTTGAVNVTPPNNFVGTLELLVTARPQTSSDTGDTFDSQLVQIQVKPSAPTSVDLVAASDTGIANDDNITNAASLQFQVNGVTSGATVQVFVGNQLAGTATATSTSATVTVTNTNLLTEGVKQITARQVVDGAQSDPTSALAVTIDRTAPPAFSSTPPTEASVGTPFTYNAQNPEEGSPGVFYSLVNPPTGLSINQTTGEVTWTPSSTQTGQQAFSIRARDAAGNSVDQAVTLNVISGPGRSDQYSTKLGTTLNVNAANGVLANDDPNNELGDPLTAQLVSNVQNGTLTLNSDGSFTYSPNASFQGADSFTYKAVSGSQESNVATVTINVTNNAPVAVNDTYSAVEDTTLTVSVADGVLKNDTDADGDTLIGLLVTQPQHGTLQFNAANGSFTYTPAANFNGTDSFTYRASDNAIQSANVATVTINVAAQPDAPVVQNLTVNSSRNAPRTFYALSSFSNAITDPDGAGQTFRVTAVANPSRGGTVEVGNNGTGFFYTPAANVTGIETFSITIADQDNQSVTATATVNIAEFQPGSVGGFVFLDPNSNGQKDAGEGGVGGLVVRLTGTTSTGAAVSERTATTAADGSYKFDNLAPGTYTIRQPQSSLLTDGPETVGSLGGQASANDQFTVPLTEGAQGTGYNFAEMRAATSLSILDFMYYKPGDSVLIAAGATGDSEFFIVESGWEGVSDFNANVNPTTMIATLRIEESDGDDFSAQNVTQFEVLNSGSTSALLRFAGNRNSFNFQPVTTTTQSQSTNAEGEAEGEAEDSAASTQWVASSHEFSMLDFLYTADVSSSVTEETSRRTVSPEMAQAVDVVIDEMARGDTTNPVHEVADAVLTDDEEFNAAVDSVFQEDVAL